MNIEEARRKGIFRTRIQLAKAWETVTKTSRLADLDDALEIAKSKEGTAEEKASQSKVLLAEQLLEIAESAEPTDKGMRALYAEEWIELREPTQAEAARLGDPLKQQDAADEIVPGCIVGHSFALEAGGTPTPKDVWALIRASATMYTHVVTTWLQSIPLVRRSGSSPAMSRPSTSMADGSPPAK